MPHPIYMLEPRSWSGLTEVPAYGPYFVSTPVYVTAVQPLKTGKGLLRVDFAQPLIPGGGLRRTIIGKVVQKTREHITLIYEDEDEIELHTAIFSSPSFDWLDTFCPALMERRPKSGPAFYVDGEALGLPTEQEHFERVFGRNEDEILHGTQRSSFGTKFYKLPKQRSTFLLDIELDPFDSCLAARGFTPTAMEEKWFVYLENGHLIFRRSWTGILIYEVDAQWRGDRLYLGWVQVNRNPKQYGETDDDYDRRLLIYIIYQVLCGKSAEFPLKDEEDVAALQAWSTVGSASLKE